MFKKKKKIRMNNYSNLREFNKSSKVGNFLHENICSLSSMRLICKTIGNIFEKEKFDVGLEVTGTSRNH